MVIGKCHIEVELISDKIIEEGHSMIKIREEVSGKATLEEYTIIEVRILQVAIEVTLGMIILEEIEVGLEKDSFQVTLGEMIEAVVNQDQEQVPIKIELDALSVGGIDHFAKTV